jgi:hypothetical protein
MLRSEAACAPATHDGRAAVPLVRTRDTSSCETAPDEGVR